MGYLTIIFAVVFIVNTCHVTECFVRPSYLPGMEPKHGSQERGSNGEKLTRQSDLNFGISETSTNVALSDLNVRQQNLIPETNHEKYDVIPSDVTNNDADQKLLIPKGEHVKNRLELENEQSRNFTKIYEQVSEWRRNLTNVNDLNITLWKLVNGTLEPICKCTKNLIRKLVRRLIFPSSLHKFNDYSLLRQFGYGVQTQYVLDGVHVTW